MECINKYNNPGGVENGSKEKEEEIIIDKFYFYF